MITVCATWVFKGVRLCIFEPRQFVTNTISQNYIKYSRNNYDSLETYIKRNLSTTNILILGRVPREMLYNLDKSNQPFIPNPEPFSCHLIFSSDALLVCIVLLVVKMWNSEWQFPGSLEINSIKKQNNHILISGADIQVVKVLQLWAIF